GSTLRINGRAHVSADPELLASFKMEGKAPRTVIVMTVEEIYFQCARAIVRADLWNPDKRVDIRSLPTPGQILAEMSDNTVGGEKYDREWPERARQTLWRSADIALRSGYRWRQALRVTFSASLRTFL